MSEQVKRWAQYVRDHPDEWKKHHTEFIDAQFEKAYDFMHRLLKQPGGRDKLIKLYGIKNIKGYEGLLGKE